MEKDLNFSYEFGAGSLAEETPRWDLSIPDMIQKHNCLYWMGWTPQ